jgi:hypothetical protein
MTMMMMMMMYLNVNRKDNKVKMFIYTYIWAGIAQSVEQHATGWTIRGSNPGGSEIVRTRPERLWGLPSLLHNGYGSFPGVKRQGRGVYHPPHLAPRLKKE